MSFMATGLEFFSIGVDFFESDCMVILETKYGSRATLLAIRLLGKIYGEGYFYRWGEDEVLLFTHRMGVDYTAGYVKEVVDALVERNFFDKEKYGKYGILTSVKIQSLYFEATQRRRQVDVEPHYLLVDVGKYKNVRRNGEEPKPEEAAPGAGGSASKPEDVGILKENADIPAVQLELDAGNADIPAQKKREEKEKKTSSSKSSPEGTPGGVMTEEEILSSVPRDGVQRNTEGLMDALALLMIPPQERQKLIRLGNWGQIGHPIWKAIYEINNSGGRINQPGKFIYSRLMKKTG